MGSSPTRSQRDAPTRAAAVSMMTTHPMTLTADAKARQASGDQRRCVALDRRRSARTGHETLAPVGVNAASPPSRACSVKWPGTRIWVTSRSVLRLHGDRKAIRRRNLVIGTGLARTLSKRPRDCAVRRAIEPATALSVWNEECRSIGCFRRASNPREAKVCKTG